MKTFKPGEEAPVSEQYGMRRASGGDGGKERATVRGEALPLTPSFEEYYHTERIRWAI